MEKTLVVLLLLCSLHGSSAEESQASVVCLSDVHAVLRNISAELAVLQFRLEQQQAINQEQAEKLKEFEVKQVAFSASLRVGRGTTGPFQTHTPLPYTNVETNIGNAYNPTTGEFRAPVRGAYHFEFYATGDGQTAVVLVKNGSHVFAASKHTSAFSTTANGVTLLLEVGDVVCLHLWQSTTIFDNEHRHSTFSGHLLFTMSQDDTLPDKRLDTHRK